MTDVTASPTYRAVIPCALREEAGIRHGMKFKIRAFGGDGVLLIPPVNIADCAEILSGVPNDFAREKGSRALALSAKKRGGNSQ